ncbi:DUF3179 domain-containing (seleno)protein [Pseudooctadecabacter jejudonensis]|uniref:DUF3179 domain-containing protein n=1 Tax=Pseudooctadecabacter jejudonensis TaxID=1391910 RepID=A0A1Y5SVC4_9RHOB|nr:DUF3179 domain-containing (seleno)protein [Pseudooctadecabacter jejudonensis]SLN49189.1 hypothetical protein PSJ8397_02540 [Pseudooctadecabacter jejudonensis]
MPRSRFRSLLDVSLLGLALIGPATAQAQTTDLPDYVIAEFGTPPAIPDGALPPELQRAVAVVFVESLAQSLWSSNQEEALAEIAASGDPRLAWLISDMMRFTWQRSFDDALAAAAAELLDIEYTEFRRWDELTNHLIAWDIPAYPGYLQHKRGIFTHFVPGWDRIFVEGDIDWRMVSWGGVLIDDRPYGEDALCNCIPAADDPEVETAQEATWLAEDAIVFGIEVNGEARAYPRQIMEVREMVNDTLGGRDLGIPYCTLCGAMQAYFTDRVEGADVRPILRTSGLLIRSNKVMYDRVTYSVFDTFLGRAVTGPLAEAGVTLDQATVITTTWGDWKAAHPDTTVLVEDLALGRNFDFRNTRDANGPIFPVGDVDPRLSVQDDIIGVITGSGRPVAFERGAAQLALQSGADVTFDDVQLTLDAGGIRAVDAGGADLGSHQAFWFAWSQFHPDTALWTPEG